MLLALAVLGLHALPAFLPQAPDPTALDLGAAFQRRLEAFVSAGRVPGVSAGVVLADGRSFALAAGRADRERQTALAPADRLCGGSTGKTFVAAVALQLAGEGALDLDAPAGKYLGDREWFERLPNARAITVEHLLSHRSGILRYEFDPEFVQAVLSAPERDWKPAELVAYVLDDEAPFAAGQGFAYSDTNYLLVGMVIEKVTGHTLVEEIRRRLLDPLELAGIREQDRRELPGLVQGYPGAQNPFGAPERTLDEHGRFFLNPQFEGAGGGFIGNGGEYARWAKALYEGPLVKPELRARMVAGEPAPALGPGMRYGLGCEIWPQEGGECWGHSGFFPGYLTEIRYWPEQRIAVAVQVNTSENAALPKPLGSLCEELLAVALAGGG